MNSQKPTGFECPHDDKEWPTLFWHPVMTDWAPGKNLSRDWRRRAATRALVRLRQGEVGGEVKVSPGEAAGLRYIKRFFRDKSDVVPARFLKGFFHYQIPDATVVSIRMSRQSELPPEPDRIVRMKLPKVAQILNLPVGPKIQKEDPYTDVVAYYDLLDSRVPLKERSIPRTTKACPSRYRTDGCACCPPMRFNEV